MSIRHLEYLFRPASVAVIGASNRPMSVGHVTMKKLLEGGFAGPIMPVHPKYDSVAGVLSYKNIEDLPLTPDLAVVCTPPPTIPRIIKRLGERGTKAAIVITAGLGSQKDDRGRTIKQAMLDSAKPFLLRVLGYNTVGLMVPGAGLNATFAHALCKPGSLAFVAQSGGMFTSVLDYAVSNDIGFSHFVSLGNMADVDLGDCLDYLANDEGTKAILLYAETITNPRKFMSAARAAARNKPVLMVKSGRMPEGARAAASHTGAMTAADDVFEAALRRTGILRVYQTEELFDAAETLGRSEPVKGNRLAVLTNGGGPGVVAADAIVMSGGRLAQLAPETIAALDEMLPRTWSGGNPVDIVGDTPGEYYGKALKVLVEDPGVDAVLVMHAPVSLIKPEVAAAAVAKVARETSGAAVLTSWIGDRHQEEARRIFREAGLPTYKTPEHACRAFMHLDRYRRRQEILTETPPSIPEEFTPDKKKAREIIDAVLADGRALLTEPEAKELLAAYGIPVVETRIALNTQSAIRIAAEIGYPVAVKILSPDITHKSDVGGVVLDVESEGDLRKAIAGMGARVEKLVPRARIDGYTVQKMARRPRAHELIVGVATDLIFGPIMLFGHGGTAVEVIADRAVGFPPLNISLARGLIEGTRVCKLLSGYRDREAADLGAISLALVKVSQLVVDFDEIGELDINPLFADEDGVLALDARVVVKVADAGGRRLVICPYPLELEEKAVMKDGRKILIRPIRPEDEHAHQEFFHSLSPEDVKFRFFGMVKSLPHSQMARFTQIDYDREMAFIAVAEDGAQETLGVVRAVSDPDNVSADFAIAVRTSEKGKGLGYLLTEKMINYLKERGTCELVCRIHIEDKLKLQLLDDYGFEREAMPEAQVVEAKLNLRK